MMKSKLALALALLFCVCTVTALAVSSPSLQSFSGSGIRKKEPPGKLQKTLLNIMRVKKSIRLKDIVTENDTFLDADGKETPVRDAEIEVIFTPEFYKIKQDGTAALVLQLSDVNAFSDREAAVVVGIPQGSGENAGVKYIEIPAEARNGKIQAIFPAWVVKQMRNMISYGWNCVYLIVSREIEEIPDVLLFELPFDEDAVTV